MLSMALVMLGLAVIDIALIEMGPWSWG